MTANTKDEYPDPQPTDLSLQAGTNALAMFLYDLTADKSLHSLSEEQRNTLQTVYRQLTYPGLSSS